MKAMNKPWCFDTHFSPIYLHRSVFSGLLKLHPRVVPYGTIRTNDLIEEAEARSGMSGADLKGALRVIADVMASRLDQGYNVELEELGFFRIYLHRSVFSGLLKHDTWSNPSVPGNRRK